MEKCFEFEDKEVCLTEKQINSVKDKFLEGYNEAQKEVEGYTAGGFKLPQGLATKKPIHYEFKVSKEQATKEHKEMHYKNALRLIQESGIDKVKHNLKFYQKLFEGDKEVEPKLKDVKEFFGVEE